MSKRNPSFSAQGARALKRLSAARRLAACTLSVALLASFGLPLAPFALAAGGAGDGAAASYKPRYKVSPGAEYVPGEVLVRFRGDSPAALQGESAAAGQPGVGLTVTDLAGGEVSLQVERFGGSELVEGLRLARVEPEDTLRAIDALNARPDVVYAEPNYIWHKDATPNDPRYGELYGLARISAPQAWDVTTGSDQVVVGVVDGGVDVNHPDLAPNVWTNPGEVPGNGVDDDGNGYADDTNGWDFAHGDRTVFDNEPEADAHATHVAGTIGARGNNGVGVVGVNWQVKIMSLKVLSETSGSISSIVSGYNYARTMRQRGVNLRALNNSYGGTGFSQTARDAIQTLNDAGILFVTSAGNDGTDNFGFPHYPSDYNLPNMLGVASSNSGDNLSGFSNYGARIITMGAPGSSILSTTPNNTYSVFSGTSMATPHVTGAAALVVAANPNIDVLRLRGVLAYSGDVLGSLQGKTTTGRRLNAFASIQSAREAGGGVDTTPPSAPSNFQVASQQGRTVTLSWNAPGDDGAAGTAADYDFFFINSSTGVRTHLPSTILPGAAGTAQSVGVNLPFRNFGGTIELRTSDNAGNTSTVSVPVTVSVNQGSDPYVVTQGAGGGLSTGGERLNVNADDRYTDYFLPFGFNFFGSFRGQQVKLSSNGAIYLPPYATAFGPLTRENGDADDVPSSVEELTAQVMIAGLWDDIDLRTCFRPDAGIYVVKPDANRVIFRWQGVTFTALNCPASPTGAHVNFEIELQANGTIITRYGSGNTGLHPVVGISGGEPDAYVVQSHTSPFSFTGPTPTINLTNAPSVTFAPRPQQASFQFSQGAYTFVESAGNATLTVTRTGDATQALTVNYSTANGSATGGNDFTATSGTLSFAPGEAQKNISVPIINDTAVESDETFTVALSSPSGGAALGSPSTATVTIHSDDTAPAPVVQFSASTATVSESAGGVTLTVTRTGDSPVITNVSYSTFDGTATVLDSDYTPRSDNFTFDAGQTSRQITIPINNDTKPEPGETFSVALTGVTAGSVIGTPSTVVVTITDDDPVPVNSVQFSVGQVTVGEGDKKVDLTVTRTGDTSGSAQVGYSTANGTATERGDFLTNLGTLSFAPDEAQKTITVFLVDDAYGNGNTDGIGDVAQETFVVALTNPVLTNLGSTPVVEVRVNNNETADGGNPVKAETFDPNFFVRQHYLDFLNREPDASGLSFWTGQTTGCGNADLLVCRINVSAAFFLSPEFQETGFYVIRAQRVAFARKSAEQSTRVDYYNFVRDARQVGEGFVDGQPGSGAVLEANKQAYATRIVSSGEFAARFSVMLSAAQYVDALYASAGVQPSAAERQQAVDAYNNAANSSAGRVAAFRRVADSNSVREAEFRGAFVLMQYYGYMRRDPDQEGYSFWLRKLDEFGGNYITAEMVKAFITSGEYEDRFGQ